MSTIRTRAYINRSSATFDVMSLLAEGGATKLSDIVERLKTRHSHNALKHAVKALGKSGFVGAGYVAMTAEGLRAFEEAEARC